jgi:hypothetical protein
MITTLEDLAKERILILDGAMGTMIQSYGLREEDFRNEALSDLPGPLLDNNDLLCLTRPDVVTENNDALKIIRSMGSASVAVDTLLEFAQGYSLAEIAERRGIPLGTVKRRIHDGRAMVHKALS